jgi:hypothetical protein
MGSESGPQVPKTSERFSVPDTDVGTPMGTVQPLRSRPAPAAYSILAGHSALIVQMSWPAGRRGSDMVRFHKQPLGKLQEYGCEDLKSYIETIAAAEYDPDAPHVVHDRGHDHDLHWINYEAHIPARGEKPGYIIPFTVLKDLRDEKNVRDVVVLFVVPIPPAPPGTGKPVAPRDSTPATKRDTSARRKLSVTSRPIFGELPRRKADAPRAARTMTPSGVKQPWAPSRNLAALAAGVAAVFVLVGIVLDKERSLPADEPRFYSVLLPPAAPKQPGVTKVATAPAMEEAAPEARRARSDEEASSVKDAEPVGPTAASDEHATAPSPTESAPPTGGASKVVITTVKVVEPDGSWTSSTTTVHTGGEAGSETRPTIDLESSPPTAAAVMAPRPRAAPSATAGARDGRAPRWERSGPVTGPYGRDGLDGQRPQ